MVRLTGLLRRYEGAVRLNFPNDYDNGLVGYKFIHVFELPRWIYEHVRVDNNDNGRKQGLIGMHLLTRHMSSCTAATHISSTCTPSP